MLLLRPTLLFIASLPFGTWAVDTLTCDPTRNGLSTGTLRYTSDCNATTWCNDGACQPKGCRRDEFPLGYPKSIELPEKCRGHQFCPDEGSSCQEKLPVGSPCQLNRDDECLGPPNFQDLRDPTGYGLNVNGSVCLNFVCQWANVTEGNPCITENTGYIAFSPGGSEFAFVVSRDNCRIGLYCDTQQETCLQQKTLGQSCTADKECNTFNCIPDGTCGPTIDDTRHLGTWVYVVVGIGIFGGMIATLVLFFFLHSRQRDVEREKRVQYWREQNAFRQNIMQLRETTRASMSMSSNRNTMYSRDGTISDEAPMLQNAVAPAKSSGLRHYVSEHGTYDGEDDDLVLREPYMDDKMF